MTPTVGSVWRKGDEERHVIYVDDMIVKVYCLFCGTSDHLGRVLSPREWDEWYAGAQCVYDPAAKPQGETMRVRAAVVLDSDSWFARGLEGESDAVMVAEALSYCLPGARHIGWMEAQFPIPTVPTVTASVEPVQ